MTTKQEFDFGEQNPEYSTLRNKRRLEEALAAATMRAQGGNFKKHPLAVLADVMALTGARSRLNALDAQEMQMYKAAQERDRLGVQELMQGMAPRAVPQHGPLEPGAAPLPDLQQPGDLQGSIAKALAGDSPRARALALAFQKNNSDAYSGALKALGGRVDPQSVLDSAGSQNISKLRTSPIEPPRLESFPSEVGGKPIQALRTIGADGLPHFQVIREPTRVEANATVGGKPAEKALTQGAEFFTAGGKGFEQQQKLRGRQYQIQQVLGTLEREPMQGTGANLLLGARKLAETLGVPPSAITSSTEVLKSQLNEAVIKELGGLGNQISNTDAERMSNAIGSIDTDPRALRTIMLLRAKYLMMDMQNLATEAARFSQHSDLKNVPFPDYGFSGPNKFAIPESFSQEFADIWAGKPGGQRPSAPRPRPGGIPGVTPLPR